MTHTTHQTQKSTAAVKTTSTSKTQSDNQKTHYQTISKMWELRFRQ